MIFSSLRSVLNCSRDKEMPVSSIGRIIGHIRWIWAGETLGRTAPQAQPRSPLYDILLRPDQLPQAPNGTAGSRRAVARSRFWRWVASPEQLAPAPGATAGGPPARSRFWRWMLTSEQLPRTKDSSKAGTRNPRAES